MKKYIFYISQNYSFAILRPIQKLLIERGDTVYWFFEGNQVSPRYLKMNEKKLESISQIRGVNPDVVIATANSIPTFIPGLKVAVFHGFDAGKVNRKGENDHFKIRGCFDLYCTQGPNTTETFLKNQRKLGYFNVIETGWPALDPLFNKPAAKVSIKPTILFCSTFSKRLSCAMPLFNEVAKISRKGNWNWLVQFHPKMDTDVVRQYKELQHAHLQFIETDDIIPLLKQADVMLCDTSSVISMFIVQKKPVVTFRNISPGPHLIDIIDSNVLEQALEKALQRPEELMLNIEQHISQLHPYHDGNSSQRVIQAIDEVLEGRHPLTKKKPRNFLRNLKFRKRLGYWWP